MKLRSIILTAIASLAVFASCDKPVQLGEPQISVDPAELTLDEAASTQKVALTATRMWKLDGQVPEWMTVTPNRGDGSNDPQTITIEVKANEGGNRTADLNFTIGLFDATLKVAQNGPKGDSVEYTTVADFIKAADTQNPCTLKGRVENTAKGDRFWGFDINDGTGVVTAAFPANWDEWKDKITDGGTVVVSGPYEYYEKKGTHQVKKCTIISFEAGEVVPPTEAEQITVADFISKADTQKPYRLVGTVENVAKGDRFWGFDINDGTGVVTAAFPANWDEWKDKIQDGGTVTVQGPYEFFEKKGTHQVKKCTIISFEAGGAVPPTEAEQITVADFISKADTQKPYKLVGTVEKTAKGDRFWGFDINDGTGVVTAAFPANWDEWKDKIQDGGTVAVQGPYEFYANKGTHQVKKCTILSFTAGGENPNPNPEPEVPGEIKKVSVQAFLAAPVSSSQWYELTGTIKSISSEQYGNLYLEDETGVVYVYGLTQTQVAKNDESFSKIGLKAGDVLTMACHRGEFKGSDQAVDGYYISHVAGEAKPERPDGPATQPFTSTISWTASTDSKNDPMPSYSDAVTVNGATEEYAALKLGTGSKFGKSTLTIPSGTTKLGFYAVAWKGTSVSLKFGNGTTVDGVRSNVGASGGKPYKLTDLTALDYFEISLTGNEGTLTVETATLGKRAVIFGINAIQ